MKAMTTRATGSAERWGPLWGARAADWAANEEQQLPTYEAGIRALGIRAGERVLDIGCGSGVFLRAAAERRAQVAGLDASPALLAIAKDRVPAADLHVGDMQFLPFADGEFDVVTGFSSFFLADDMVAALREAGRVAKPAGRILIQVWGRPEACDLEAMKVVVRPFLPPPPPGAAPGPPLWQPGVLEELASEAGLTPQRAFDISWAFEYPDEASLLRGLLSAGGLATLVPPAREAEVRAALVAALEPFRTPEGAYRLENEWRLLVAIAPG
jgi:SAM-dependent methyltransferase